MRILLAEDDATNRRVLEVFLSKWGYEIVMAVDGHEAWNFLQQSGAPQLAILDWMMPGKDGVQVCRELRQQSREHYTYVLLLTTKAQKKDLIEGMEAGADDYLVKPFDADELYARLRAGRRILDLQEQLVAAREAFHFQATHDGLTGLWTRTAALEELQRQVARCARDSSSVAVLLADVDHFKTINDTRGHLAGDAVLRDVARKLAASVRPYDVVGRYGGEEFLLIVPGSDEEDAFSQAERIRKCIADTPLDTSEGPVSVTLSIGVAATTPGPTKWSVESLLRVADEALYRAKARGRNCVEMGSAKTPEPVSL